MDGWMDSGGSFFQRPSWIQLHISSDREKEREREREIEREREREEREREEGGGKAEIQR